MKPHSIIVVSLISISLCSGGCMTSPKPVHQDEIVTIYTRESMLPHGTGDTVLEVRGRTFSNLYSARYARVPEWNAIVFVTHREGGSYKIHLFDLGRRKDLAVEVDDALGFSGSGLGLSKTNRLTCYVDKVDGEILVLVEKAFNAHDATYMFNRQTKQFARYEPHNN